MLKTFFVGQKNWSSFCGEAIEGEKRGFKTKIETFAMKDIQLNFFHLGFHCVAFFEKEFDPKLFASVPMCAPAFVRLSCALRMYAEIFPLSPFTLPKVIFCSLSFYLTVFVLKEGKLLGESFFLFNQSRVILSART